MAKRAMNFDIIIDTPTRAQSIRAEEKSWEMYDVLTRLLVAACCSDAESAVEADPYVFDDGFALLRYITVGEQEG